jgi:hypothetical protein
MGWTTWADRIGRLDPEHDHLEVHQLVCAHEFPWDTLQALSLALFRTYAVPTIGGLLDRTGEMTGRAQKRYEDTGLLLDAVLEHGADSGPGRQALRRINGMHAAYDISQDDLRYVLSTFVVMPIRWNAAYGWRPLTELEKRASVAYHRELGRRMGIRDLPGTWQDWERLLDDHEARHFAFHAGGRRVADATLDLFTTFPLHDRLPRSLVRAAALALMDDPLLTALGYRRPPAVLCAAVRGGLRLRARVVRWLPRRRVPLHFRSQPVVRGYPGGYDVSRLGTFPRTCPVPHRRSEGAPAG